MHRILSRRWKKVNSKLKWQAIDKFLNGIYFFIRTYDSMFLLTASEVILGTAIVMGLSALVTILLRICSRPRYARNTADPNIPDEFGRVGIRASLTSLQQRVMSKLRDRPPRYETRHNYEYQRREGTTRIAVLNPAAACIAASSTNIPPPAYDNGDNNSVSFIRITHHISHWHVFIYFSSSMNCHQLTQSQ